MTWQRDSKGNLSALSSHEGFHLDATVALVLRADALSIEPEFEQTAIFFYFWKLYVPLKPRVLTGGCGLLVNTFSKGSREANHLHTLTKSNLRQTSDHPN